ncbi:MAG: hypothetical protein H6835_17715 [Planctomycetes bacterium]|nr:hypothetical protein [Planctomycetota bacterium]
MVIPPIPRHLAKLSVSLLLPVFASAQDDPTADSTIPWQQDLAAARAQAAERHAPLFVVFRCER